MVSLQLGPYIGSDHFPIIAKIRVEPELAKQLNTSVVETAEKDDADLDARAGVYQGKLDKALLERETVAALAVYN